jgi:N-acetylglutamate synthase-like GNAT family acetyltransferase
MAGWMLRERLFGPPPANPDLLLAARDAAGRLIGIAAGAYPCRREGIGGVRWLGTLPAFAERGVEAALLEALLPRLRRLGAEEAHMLATPPHYIRPGIDIRETALIATLQGLGWSHAATHFNMTCNLTEWSNPGEAAIFGPGAGGEGVRRARPSDLPALRGLIETHWTPGWRDAATLGFGHDPAGVFVAEKAGELLGFAAYEVDQCLGSFGPTGVVEAARGSGLGKRLLWACLNDLQRLGRAECQIGWIGPAGFYYRSCGATIGPAYWMLSKRLDGG